MWQAVPVDSAGWHLAQVNVSTLLEPIDSPRLEDFVAELDPVNASADAAPGFVWRLMAADGNATSIRVFDDPMVIVNLTVWESVEALKAFAYGDPGHRAVMRDRSAWFERHREASFALWWIAAGGTPTVADAAARLEHLRLHGPTQTAFTFRERFPAGNTEMSPAVDGAHRS
jgi:heme-degrading monooxygenase HmoA